MAKHPFLPIWCAKRRTPVPYIGSSQNLVSEVRRYISLTNIEIIWLLPARAAKEFRRQSAHTICRVLGGDTSLCDEIEQRYARLQSTEEGRAYQNFVMYQGPAKKTRSEAPFWFEYASDKREEGFPLGRGQESHSLETD